MPPAKLSPAPVGSTRFSVGNAGSTYVSCSPKNIAPCSPFLITTNRGPISRTRLAEFIGKLRLETAKHIELDIKRLPVVHVWLVAAGPAKGLALGHDLDAGD